MVNNGYRQPQFLSLAKSVCLNGIAETAGILASPAGSQQLLSNVRSASMMWTQTKNRDHFKSRAGRPPFTTRRTYTGTSSPLRTGCKCDKKPSLPVSELPRKTVNRTGLEIAPRA